MIIKNNISKLVVKFGVFGLKKITRRKRSILKEVIDKPEDFKLEAFIEGEEILIKVKKKQERP